MNALSISAQITLPIPRTKIKELHIVKLHQRVGRLFLIYKGCKQFYYFTLNFDVFVDLLFGGIDDSRIVENGQK